MNGEVESEFIINGYGGISPKGEFPMSMCINKYREYTQRIFNLISNDIIMFFNEMRKYRSFLLGTYIGKRCTIEKMSVNITPNEVILEQDLEPYSDVLCPFLLNFPFNEFESMDEYRLTFGCENEHEIWAQKNVAEIFKRIYIPKSDCPNWINTEYYIPNSLFKKIRAMVNDNKLYCKCGV